MHQVTKGDFTLLQWFWRIAILHFYELLHFRLLWLLISRLLNPICPFCPYFQFCPYYCHFCPYCIICPYCHFSRCLKITKKYHSTLQAKRATFTFWVDKSSLKMPNMVHFCEFLETWSLWSNSVTRQVSFNRTKIGGKCQNAKIHMRHFE